MTHTYEEGEIGGRCGAEFEGQTKRAARATPIAIRYICTRKRGHTGPHQWVRGEMEADVGWRDGEFTEYHEEEHYEGCFIEE